MGIGPYTILIIFLLSPLLLLFFKNKFSIVGLFVTAGLLIIARILMIFFENIIALSFITGIGISAFFIFLPNYLIIDIKEETKPLFITLTQAIGLSLCASIALKALGSSFDYSTFGFGIIIFFILLVLLLLMLPGFYFQQKAITDEKIKNEIDEAKTAETHETIDYDLQPLKKKSFGKIFLLSMGIYGIVSLLWFALGYPSAFSRWSNASPLVLTIITIVSITFFLVLLLFVPHFLENIRLWIVILLNLFLAGCILIISILSQPEFALTQQIFTYVTAILTPVALLDFLLLIKEFREVKPTTRQLGGAFGISSVLFLIISFMMVVSFNYEWVPGTTFLRDRYYLIILLVILLVLIPVILINGIRGFNRKIITKLKREIPRKNQIVAVIILILAITGVSLGLGLNIKNPVYPSSPTELTIMSYNIHQGEDKNGKLNFLRVLETLQKTNPDIIGIQESEMGRICFGNTDIIRFLAEKMNMFIHYGPNTIAGTYGVATLSRYPIESTEYYFLPSEGHSQRVILKTTIQVGSEIITVFNAHLGLELEERISQAQYIADFLPGVTRSFFVGDYNTKDTETPYTYLVPPLIDSWLEVNPTGTNATGYDGDTNRFPLRRIDYIFHTADLTITDIEVLTWANESDHWPVLGTFSL
jgi:endonuclease/exonuclease/phosphatase family metal-dependent hydrolase